ncbi:zinc finger protein 845 [Anopheles gambiae]|uniref:zinc finger protein 845 n=1 Tax=Anopheles gambiae TaxID=7165 RepID=UPI002AC8F313|nr:zinc finger protein 845 [Anopheles gambiae]
MDAAAAVAPPSAAAAAAPPPPPPPLPLASAAAAAPPPPNSVYDVINQKECGLCLTLRAEQICFDMFMPREDDPKEMPYLVWKHVGLQFPQEAGKHYVCRDCGYAVYEFNRFYLMVQNVHQERQAAAAAAVLQPKQEPPMQEQVQYNAEQAAAALEGVNQNGHHGGEQKFDPSPLVDGPVPLLSDVPDYGMKHEVNGMLPSGGSGVTAVGGNGTGAECPSVYTSQHNDTEPESSRIRPVTGNTPSSRKRRNQEMDDEIIDFYKLVCDVCEERIEYGTMKELNQHMKLMHGEETGRVSCPQCGKMFRTRGKLLEHKSVHQRQDATSEDDAEKLQSEQMDKEILEFYKRISCDVCDAAASAAAGAGPQACAMLYATVKELNHHMRLVHGQQAGTVKCPLCEKKIRTRPKLLEHKRMHQPNALLEEDSGKSGNPGGEPGPELTEEQKQTLDREIFDFYKPIICEICDPEKVAVAVAVAGPGGDPGGVAAGAGHPEAAAAATTQEEEYRSLKQLNQHMRTVHGLESGTVKCQLCAKKFRSRVKLVEHKDMHENPERFRCGVCQEVHQNLEEHMQNKHQEWEFACEECGKRFPFKNRLTAHMAKVHMKKDIICEECNKPFTKFSIEKHKKTVHGHGGTFICENCPKTFKTRVSLERHMEGHNNGEQQQPPQQQQPQPLPLPLPQQQPSSAATVSCSLCNSVLKDEYNLKAHMKRIHAEQTPATCNTCGKTFKSKHSLNTHTANVCTTRLFGCTTCGKQFKKRTKLKQHMTIHPRGAD